MRRLSSDRAAEAAEEAAGREQSEADGGDAGHQRADGEEHDGEGVAVGDDLSEAFEELVDVRDRVGLEHERLYAEHIGGFERYYLVLSVALKVVPAVRPAMTRDASLAEFGVGGDEESTSDDADGAPTEEPEPSPTDGTTTDDDAGATDGGPEPIRPTSRWTAEPSACAECGTPVQRTWNGDDGPVCSDCKRW